jgi:hypothetical protein
MKTFSLFASFWLLIASTVAAGEPGVKVISASDDLLESQPRRVVTSIFFVSNEAEEEIHLTPRIDLPPGWHLIASDPALHLRSGQREMSLVSFLIPRTAQAGSYKVGFSVHPQGGQAGADSSSIRVDIVPISRLRVEVLEAPEFVVAGETYRASIVVMNQGNSTTQVEISAASHTGFPMQDDTEPVSLQPGESAAFYIGVATDPGIREVMQERLSITARALNEPGTKDQAWCYLEILPRVTGMRSRFNKVPVMSSVSYFSEQSGWEASKTQATFRGSGNLDDQGRQHIDFMLRGPDLGQNRLLGNRDEYFVKYRYGGQTLILGDYSYSVSPLTESHRYGRGGKASVALGHLNVGGYHMKARWSESDREQTAGHVDYHFGEESLVGLRYLKRGHDREDEMMSLESRFQPSDDTDVQLEYAHALGRDRASDAYRLKCTSLTSWGSYLLRFIRAGSDYTGYYQDMDFISTSLGLHFLEDVRLDASFRQERHNLNLDPSRYTAPLERDYRIRLLFRSGTSLDYSLAYKIRESRDRFAEGLFDFREKSVRAALSQRNDRWDCNAAAEIGRTRDRLNDNTRRLERYTATLRMKPSSRQSYHAYFYYDRNGGPGPQVTTHLSAGVSASVALDANTALDAGVRSNFFKNIENQDQDVVELSLRRQLFRHTELIFRGHYTDYRDKEESRNLAFMVQYSIPFGMPISRRDEVGSLKGSAYDQETGLPLADVILKLDGATAVTDRSGRFSFPTIPVGAHHLTVDRSSIGLDRIPLRRFPAEITIRGGKTTSLEIPVVRGATISGRIEIFAYEDSTAGILTPLSRRRLERTGHLANTMIELTDGDETKRILTARDGTFAAHELRPGRWTLVIPLEHLPEYHRVDNTDLRFTLKPGQTEHVSIRIVPKDRPVMILEDGGTLTEEPRSR